jgi:hypothetical protein
MGTCNESQPIGAVEGLGIVLAKGVTSTTWRDTPTRTILGIGPQQITHRSLMGHFLDAIQGSDVIQSIDRGTQTTMEAEDLVLDQSSQRQEVEESSERSPDIGIAVLAQALVIEAIAVQMQNKTSKQSARWQQASKYMRLGISFVAVASRWSMV